MAEGTGIPTIGRASDLNSADFEAIGRFVAENFNEIRNTAGEYHVPSRRFRGGSIPNYVLAPDVRAAKAIVSPQGQATGGDFTDIQQAIDRVNDLGGGTVLIKAGTYNLSSDLTLYDSIILLGEEGTILTISGGNGTINVQGTNVIDFGYGDGVDVTNGDATVTDSGATWQTDGVSSGDSLYIYGVPYKIDSVTNETSLELTSNYNGKTESTINYRISSPISYVSVINIEINGDASTDGINVSDAENISITNCSFRDCQNGILMNKTFNVEIRNNYAFGCTTGLKVGGRSAVIRDNYVSNCSGDGIHLGNGAFLEAYYFIVIGNQSIANGSDGIYAEGIVSSVIQGNQTNFNNGWGIILEADSGSV